MKQPKRTRIPILSAVLLAAALTLLTACGSSSAGYEASSAAVSTAPVEAPEARDMAGMSASRLTADGGIEMAEEGAAGNAGLSDRKIVRRAGLSLETKEFDTAVTEIVRIVTEAGGYLDNQWVGGVSLYERGSYSARTAEINARIPAERLDEVANSVGGLCNVVSKSESADDITDRYYDTEAHLNTLMLQEERLLAILEKAEKLEDVISLEQALSETRYEIETLTAAMKRMDGQVAYSYLDIDLTEVVDYNLVEGPPKTFGEKLSASFARSGNKIASALEDVLFFIIEDLPAALLTLAFWGAAFFIFWKLILRRIVQRWNARREQLPPAPAPSYDSPDQKKEP